MKSTLDARDMDTLSSIMQELECLRYDVVNLSEKNAQLSEEIESLKKENYNLRDKIIKLNFTAANVKRLSRLIIENIMEAFLSESEEEN